MKHFSELSPQEVLAYAISIEENNAVQFEEWAQRFLPYNKEISDLLEEMAQEEVEHGDILKVFYDDLFDGAYNGFDINNIFERPEPSPKYKEHFFIIDHETAVFILELVLSSEEYAKKFYTDVANQVKDETLKSVYTILANFEKDHALKIEKFIKEFKKKAAASKRAV